MRDKQFTISKNPNRFNGTFLMDKYNSDEFARLIGVSDRTLRRWDSTGTFCAYRTPSGRPYYTDKHYRQYTQPDFRLNKNKDAKKRLQHLDKQLPPTAC